jgi:hypothetical protein
MPSVHWTSYLRSRSGHKPYDPPNLSVSTFTIQDTSGRLAAILTQKGCQQVKYLTKSPTFHIQVVPSAGPVCSTFDIDSEQIKKVSRVLDDFLFEFFASNPGRVNFCGSTADVNNLGRESYNLRKL